MTSAPAFPLSLNERALLRSVQLSEADEDGTRYPAERLRSVPVHVRSVYHDRLEKDLLALAAAGMLHILDWDRLTVELTESGVNFED